MVEMITVVAIMGLILLLLGYEFDGALEHLLHTRSNQDMETTARVAMRKVTNRLRTATPWVFSGAADTKLVMLSPVPTNVLPGATGPVLSFYRVRPASLSDPATIKQDANGNPILSYDIVTIQRSTCPTLCGDPSPNYLVETAVDAATTTPTETPLVLAKDVSGFSVTALGPNGDQAQVGISLTVTSTSSRCTPKCSYTANNTVWVSGDPTSNE